MSASVWNPGNPGLRFIDPRSSVEVSATVGAASQQQQYDGHMDWDNAGGWFMFSVMAVFWIGVIALGWWAISSNNRRHEMSRESPLDVARHRLARGEITAEEFERIRETLTK